MNEILRQRPHLARLITTTTRAPRPGEQPDREYHFMSNQQFQEAVESGEMVCPIVHRGAWYGTLRQDLCACAQRETMSVLRPDKISELRALTPILGIYIVRHDIPFSEDDQIIAAHQHRCTHRVTNVSGHVDEAVTQILSILEPI